jgi:hypothetical protein
LEEFAMNRRNDRKGMKTLEKKEMKWVRGGIVGSQEYFRIGSPLNPAVSLF